MERAEAMAAERSAMVAAGGKARMCVWPWWVRVMLRVLVVLLLSSEAAGGGDAAADMVASSGSVVVSFGSMLCVGICGSAVDAMVMSGLGSGERQAVAEAWRRHVVDDDYKQRSGAWGRLRPASELFVSVITLICHHCRQPRHSLPEVLLTRARHGKGMLREASVISHRPYA